ncbi:hypothetical protein OG21DRAFT_353924 [Imleria badia]|nr:hypothetical protein OG21DRAFT_353924 [Imleria badia]
MGKIRMATHGELLDAFRTSCFTFFFPKSRRFTLKSSICAQSRRLLPSRDTHFREEYAFWDGCWGGMRPRTQRNVIAWMWRLEPSSWTDFRGIPRKSHNLYPTSSDFLYCTTSEESGSTSAVWPGCFARLLPKLFVRICPLPACRDCHSKYSSRLSACYLVA